jgi:hypothetical protein
MGYVNAHGGDTLSSRASPFQTTPSQAQTRPYSYRATQYPARPCNT